MSGDDLSSTPSRADDTGEPTTEPSADSETEGRRPRRAHRASETTHARFLEAQVQLGEAQALFEEMQAQISDAQTRISEQATKFGEEVHEQATKLGEEVHEQALRVRRRVGLPPGFNVGGALRHRMWRSFFQIIGGFRVTGSAPYQAMVVAANHQSHADTPALLAAMPSPYKPVVVAADDYWFESKARRTLMSVTVGGVPVDRTSGHGYTSLVTAAEQVLGAGSTLLIFPEGTRSKDGQLGRMHAGALRLVREFDVPLLPVAVVGTHELFPKNGRIRPGPVEVRVGKAIAPQDLRSMKQVAEQIQELIDQGPAVPGMSHTWQGLDRFMASPAGPLVGALWSFAEALSFPVASEAYLFFVAAARPQRIPATVVAQAMGSAAGVLTHYALVRSGRYPATPLTTASMHAAATEHAATGARGIRRQALSGIPVKVHAAAAGRAALPVSSLLTRTVAAQTTRAAAAGAAIGTGAWWQRKLLHRAYGPYLTAAAALYGIGLAGVIAFWHRRR